ncbi:MAG TPA: hemolysin family protein [Chlamydiales bacterium]|nr:hemolysin family protein [Chlamydiales bacterium]
MIALLVFLITISALISGSETALFSISHTTLKSFQGSPIRNRRLIFSLMTRPRDVLVTLLMLNMLVNILIQNTVANLFTGDSWVYKVGVPLILVLIFGEIIPKSFAYQKNVPFAIKVAPFVDWFSKVLTPIRKPLTRLTNWISRFLFFFLKKEDAISSDELRHVLQTSEEKGILMAQERDLVEGTLDLQESIVRERMRPRDEVLYFDINQPLSQLIHLFVDLETTRVPVCDGNLEKMIGILTTRRYFLNRNQIQKSSDLRSIVKKPYFVPETTRSWTLLQNLRERGESLAIVVDEYGSISGIISQEDLIEAVIGEIKDRRDLSTLYTRSGPDAIIASGKLELTDFEEIFGVALPTKENIVTLAGFLIEQIGDIPKVGTKFSTDSFLFHVIEAEPNRILRIYVRRLRNGKQ